MPLLDTARTIETPEGVSIHLRLAGPAPRALAWLLDTLLQIVIVVVLQMTLAATGLSGGLGAGLFLISLFLIQWFYPVLFEVYSQGATPGKKAMGLVVLQDDGVPVGWSASMVRNLLRAVDFLPASHAFGLCSMLLNRNFKRLGDIVAKTIVVHRDRPRPLQKFPPGPALPLPIWLSSSEQQLIVAFAARVPQLTPERAQELALILHSKNGKNQRPPGTLHANVESLLGYARHIVGER